MYDEFERIWKEVVTTLSRYYSIICLEGLRKRMKKSVMMVSGMAEIQVEHLLYTSPGCCS
jgi:hypothetical protein